MLKAVFTKKALKDFKGTEKFVEDNHIIGLYISNGINPTLIIVHLGFFDKTNYSRWTRGDFNLSLFENKEEILKDWNNIINENI